MSAPREAFRVQLVENQPRQSLANSLEQTIMLRKVTSVVKLMEWIIQGATKVKVLSSEIANIIEVDTFHVVEDSMRGNDKASYHSLYRDPRPYHVLRWSLNELGRSFVFLLRYAGTSQQRRGLTEDAKEVGLIDSTQSVGKPHTRGSGQQYSNGNKDCNTDTTEIGGICKEN
ncbi:hypothetical protein [Wolbachia endosymbiont (group B) of Rhopobota naevana]|uniref:hypothetical protein n=1 Tax=Wolbachia endosymbiont (group B) of Rhopobota naevana TaxID=2954054 RepID=UPI002227BF7A|nr:hypothetical protein [Wolbachia endosymbiont (group B) of Rhopobota naevana]